MSAPSHLDQYGLTATILDHFQAAQTELPDTPICLERILRRDKTRLIVTGERGPRAISLGNNLRAPDGSSATTGDWVLVEDGADKEPRALRLLPRTSQLDRKRAFDDSTERQVLAANMSWIGVVIPLDRKLSVNRLERTLVAAWDSGATPLIILTKADLSRLADDVVAQVRDHAPGVDVVTTSAREEDGLDELRSRVRPGETLLLLGPSGAGKSSLINALAGQDIQATGEVRELDQRGKHTTTARELIAVSGGMVLLDTPGVRGFALYDAQDALGAVFEDIDALIGRCRFNDCQHRREPGCAIRAAIESGEVSEERLKHYKKLQREMDFLADRKAARQRMKAQHKDMAKGSRAAYKRKYGDNR